MVTILGPLAPAELAALLNVEQPHPDVVRSLGSPGFFDPEVAERGRASLLLRAAAGMDDVTEIDDLVARIRAYGAVTLGEPGRILRVATMEEDRRSCRIVIGDGRLVIAVAAPVGYFVTYDDSATQQRLRDVLSSFGSSSRVVVEVLANGEVEAFAWVGGRVGRRVGLTSEWLHTGDEDLDLFAARVLAS